MLFDPEGGAAMGRRGQERAVGVFDKEITNRTMEGILAEIADL
jgi:hypothetical protein